MRLKPFRRFRKRRDTRELAVDAYEAARHGEDAAATAYARLMKLTCRRSPVSVLR
jgi:hypothetical protein